ncbi:N-6 DNA methylase [Mumia sp. DW29H23]|uniref:N-6 DNA methylase n=1 Tax=Mumia sp. DW29H23 TaxID=3421241 RepID=UPI003D68A565
MNTTPRQALLAPSDIANLAGVSAAAVSNWRKRSEDFPEPAGGTATRPLFARNDVIAWLQANDKPVIELAASNAIAALNLAHETLPASSAAGLDIAARLVVTLCTVRKLSDPTDREYDLPLWWNFVGRVTHDGFAASSDLGNAYGIELWDQLIQVPEEADLLPRDAVDEIANLIEQIPVNELAAAADAVLARTVGAKGRAGSDHGYIGNGVSDFLAQITTQDARGVVYDPACGIGDVLTQLAGHDAARGSITRMVGHDVDPGSIVIARQRAFLRDEKVDLNVADVLAEDPAPGIEADLVVVDPPYGMPYDGYDVLDRRWTYGTPSKASSEFAWMQHAIAHLADEGVAYVVTPSGPLHRGGRDGQIRRSLIADGCVHAIYQLPRNLLRHVSIPLAVWALGRPGASVEVKFVVAESVKFTGSWPDFEKANPMAVVSIEDVLAGDANLVPDRWLGLDTPDPAGVANTYALAVDRIRAAGRDTESADLHPFAATGYTQVATIGELKDRGALEIRTAKTAKGDEDDPRRVTTRDIAAGRLDEPDTGVAPGMVSELPDARELTVPGDVLLSTLNQLAAVLDEFGGHILGAGVVGLRVRDPQLRPDYLAAVVDGRWNKRFFTGQAVQRVPVRDLEVPILTLADQEAFARAAADLRNIQRIAAQLQTAATDALASLAEIARYGIATDPDD